MTQLLFKVGGVYASKGGAVMRVEHILGHAKTDSHYFSVSRLGIREFGHDGSRFIDGSYFGDHDDEASLIPGELHQVDGAWVPITEQSMSVYFADAQEGTDAAYSDWMDAMDLGANTAMILRDGPAAPKPAVVALPAAPTAHPAIVGLTVVSGFDHRLGARVVHGS